MSIDLVLCATDLSLEEGTAWRSAGRLIQALNARVRLVHVIEPVIFPYTGEGPDRENLREKLRSEFLSEARRAVRARLASLEREWAEGYRADKRQDRSGDRTRGIRCPDDPSRGRAYGRRHDSRLQPASQPAPPIASRVGRPTIGVRRPDPGGRSADR